MSTETTNKRAASESAMGPPASKKAKVVSGVEGEMEDGIPSQARVQKTLGDFLSWHRPFHLEHPVKVLKKQFQAEKCNLVNLIAEMKEIGKKAVDHYYDWGIKGFPMMPLIYILAIFLPTSFLKDLYGDVPNTSCHCQDVYFPEGLSRFYDILFEEKYGNGAEFFPFVAACKGPYWATTSMYLVDIYQTCGMMSAIE